PGRLVAYGGREGASRAGALDGDRVGELRVRASGVLERAERWDRVEPALREFDPGGARAVDWAELELPLRYPRKVLCSGTNYYAHMREMKVNRDPAARPYFFLKPPTTSLIGPGEAIAVPTDPSAHVDWQAELAGVTRRRSRHVPESEALAYVAGYSAINDG